MVAGGPLVGHVIHTGAMNHQLIEYHANGKLVDKYLIWQDQAWHSELFIVTFKRDNTGSQVDFDLWLPFGPWEDLAHLDLLHCKYITEWLQFGRMNKLGWLLARWKMKEQSDD